FLLIGSSANTPQPCSFDLFRSMAGWSIGGGPGSATRRLAARVEVAVFLRLVFAFVVFVFAVFVFAVFLSGVAMRIVRFLSLVTGPPRSVPCGRRSHRLERPPSVTSAPGALAASSTRGMSEIPWVNAPRRGRGKSNGGWQG